MSVLITGATGLVGKEIVKQCHLQGIKVNYLTTSKEKIKKEGNYEGFYWNPAQNEIDINCFNDVYSIINLAGASIASRWTTDYKRQILSSRIDSLNLLKNSITKHKLPVRNLVSASAIGIYPSSLTKYYEVEDSVTSSTFLGQVCEQWERAALSFKELDMHVNIVRVGLVLDKEEGVLSKLVTPTKLGLGAAFGNGTQWQSWIHKEDLATLFLAVLKKYETGIYNGVAPNPVTNQEFVREVASVLNKPLLLPNIPKLVMKLTLGEMHILLFESQRVCAKKNDTLDFYYKFPNLIPALQDLLH